MTDLEKQAVKDFSSNLVDKILPELITAEEAKLPPSYAPLVKLVTDALLPELQKILDAKIAAL